MANRMRRGGAAALLAERQGEDIEVDEDENEPAVDVVIEDDDEPDPVVVDPEPEDADDEPESEPEEDADPLAAASKQFAAQLAELQGKNEQLAHDRDATELVSQQTIVASGLQAAKQQLASARAELGRASAAGDHDKIAAAHEKLALAAVDVREFEAAADEVKSNIEAFRKTPPKRAAQPQQPAGDQFEAAIAPMSKASQDWCRANKADLTSSPARGYLVQAADADAKARGLKVDTPEYFAYIEKVMGYEAQPMPKTKQKTAKPVGQARVAAPGGVRAATSNGREEVTLTKAEQQIAKSMGMTLKRYAANKLEIEKNGRDPSRGGPTFSHHSLGGSRR